MNRTSPHLEDIVIFVAVAENASFTRAAQQLSTSKSNVGKAVQRIEARLGTRLFQRTTRAVRLTEDGQIYLEAARRAIDGLADAETALATRRREPVGHVRVDIAVGLGTAVIPTLAEFRRVHPKVTLELSLNDRLSDPVRDGWDIVVRIGDLPAGGDTVVRKLCDLRYGLFASPRYLKERPPIREIEDLREQDGVIYRRHSGQLRSWLLRSGDGIVEFLPRTTVVTLDGRTLIDSVRAGLGMGQIFDQVAAPFVVAKELVPILPALVVPGLPVHALIPIGRRMPPKTRVVLEHLSAALRSVTGSPRPHRRQSR
jgi:DNA-binding transcriptional LysR family regulator